jgi:hypothetical protein
MTCDHDVIGTTSTIEMRGRKEKKGKEKGSEGEKREEN